MCVMEDLLRQLAQISSTLYQQTTSSPSIDFSLGFSFDIPDFLLPFPELELDIPAPDSLVSTLVEAGAPDSFARELSEIHAECARELADQYSKNYRNSCLQIAEGVDDASRTRTYFQLQRTGVRLFTQTLGEWERDLLRIVKDRRTSSTVKKEAANRSTFNSVGFNFARN